MFTQHIDKELPMYTTCKRKTNPNKIENLIQLRLRVLNKIED